MKILNHRLATESGADVEFLRTPNQSGPMTPEYLVVHYTAGRDAASSIEWLLDRRAQASAHLVIARDGQMTQLAAFNRTAWHAGESRWAGRGGVNGFSIGIELDNPGKLEHHENGWFTLWGDPVDDGRVVLSAHKNGGGVCGWHSYPAEQLTVLRDVAAALVIRYDLKDVIGHDDIAPGRKSDPGPAFPMGSLRSGALGRREESPAVFRATARLNIRSGPGVEWDTLPFGPLPAESRLEVIEQRGVWRLVDVLDEIDGDTHRTGWVHAHYLSA